MLRGTCGNVQVFLRREGESRTPELDRFHPEIREPADSLPTELHCTELLQSVPQILFANLTTAACILNAVWLFLCGALHYGEICFDIERGRMAPVPGSSGP